MKTIKIIDNELEFKFREISQKEIQFELEYETKYTKVKNNDLWEISKYNNKCLKALKKYLKKEHKDLDDLSREKIEILKFPL